jgi:2,5-dioxopentanoate dehydrogenase
VVKGHPSHPETSRLVAGAITLAAQKCGMHPYVFQHIEGDGFEIGKALVQHPRTAAVGFTGSLKGGRAIFDYGQQRYNPIPVFAEMGSTNPVIILPEILSQQGEGLSKQLATSITMGVGQFCTNPGIILALEGAPLSVFAQNLADNLAAMQSFKMLNPGIHKNYIGRISEIESVDGIEILYKHTDEGDIKAPAMIAKVKSEVMASHPSLREEVFGPSSLIVECKNMEELISIWKLLHGQLSTTLFGTKDDLANHAQLLDIAKHIAGRIVFNNVPTGVDVNAATVHGGPYPSSTDGRFTSVGMDAIKRWVRPVCYQDCPDSLLPIALQNSNPSGILRKVNGQYHRDKIS